MICNDQKSWWVMCNMLHAIRHNNSTFSRIGTERKKKKQKKYHQKELQTNKWLQLTTTLVLCTDQRKCIKNCICACLNWLSEWEKYFHAIILNDFKPKIKVFHRRIEKNLIFFCTLAVDYCVSYRTVQERIK